tara:strand:+ start:1228 stop:1341 length:114 start_codon:yes stop_codon:yes gene_type:complete
MELICIALCFDLPGDGPVGEVIIGIFIIIEKKQYSWM